MTVQHHKMMTSATATPHSRTYIHSTFNMPPGYRYTPTNIGEIEPDAVLSHFRACIDDLAQLAIVSAMSEAAAQDVVEAYLNSHQNDLDGTFKILNDMFLLPAIALSNPMDAIFDRTATATPITLTDRNDDTSEESTQHYDPTDPIEGPQMASNGANSLTNGSPARVIRRSHITWEDRLSLNSLMDRPLMPREHDATDTASSDGSFMHADSDVSPMGSLDDDGNEPLLPRIVYGRRAWDYYNGAGRMMNANVNDGRNVTGSSSPSNSDWASDFARE